MMADELDRVPPVTVLGIGNIVLRDEGFGVRVAEYIDKNYEFPDEVQVLDGGTLGMELLRFITGTKKLLILDAVKADKPPGTIYHLEGDEVKNHFAEKLSAHEIGIQDVLTLLELTGKPITEVTVIGAVPADLEAGTELSETLKPIVEKAAEMAMASLRDWGVEIRKSQHSIKEKNNDSLS